MEPADPQPYVAAAVALAPRCVFRGGTVDDEAFESNIVQCAAEAVRMAELHGARLIVFPQFGLTGHAMVPAEAWCEAAVAIDSRPIDRIAQAAHRSRAFIAVQVPERHAAFPGRYFLSCIIIGPDDGLVLVHRKSYSLSLRTSPTDVHDRFVEILGQDAFHPVADTAIGRLGATIGGELHWPEACRSLALKGAEVIVNPVAAAPHLDYLQRAGAEHVRSVRAFENMTYLVTANIGAPEAPRSAVHDFKGGEVSRNSATDPAVALATLDLAALRAWREQASANFLAQIQPQTDVRPDPALHWPANRWPDQAPSRFEELAAVEATTWRRLQDCWSR